MTEEETVNAREWLSQELLALESEKSSNPIRLAGQIANKKPVIVRLKMLIPCLNRNAHLNTMQQHIVLGSLMRGTDLYPGRNMPTGCSLIEIATFINTCWH